MDLEELLLQQGGVVTHRQALACGAWGRQLRPGGRLVRLRRDVYAERARLEVLDEPERTALDVAAVRLTTGVDLVAAGRTAALVHGLPVLGRPRRLDVVERKDLRPRHHGNSTTLRADDVG